VLRAVEGQVPPVSAYGVRFDSLHKITILSERTGNIVQSMQHHGIQRYRGMTFAETGGDSQRTAVRADLAESWSTRFAPI